MYQIGDLVMLSASFSASTGAATDPTALKLTVRAPGGSIAHTYGVSSSLIKDATGLYHLNYPAASAGVHYAEWSASGTVEGMQESTFTVSRTLTILAAYAETKDVAAYCANLIAGATDFSDSTVPGVESVINWLNRGKAIIDNIITSRGFDTPTDQTSAAWLWLQELNTHYAVAQAEMARTNVRLGPGERTRGQQFLQMWKDGLEELRTENLSATGMDYASLGYIGGISVADKDAVADNEDREPLAFGRGQFNNPETLSTHERDEARRYDQSRRRNASDI